MLAAFVGIALVAGLLYRALVGPTDGGPPWFPFFGFWAFFLFFFLFWAARWFFWPWGWGYRRGPWYRDESYAILRERYARGEITKEQYDQMVRDLSQHP